MLSRLHLRVERHIPHLDGRVRASPCQPSTAATVHLRARARARASAGGQPEYGIDAPGYGILDHDVLQRLPDAPHVYVRVERAGGAVLRVRGPAQRVYACAVEGPARCDRLALRHVVQDDLPARLDRIGQGK